MSLFQSNLRKQIRELQKFLKFARIVQYHSISFNRILRCEPAGRRRPHPLQAIRWRARDAAAREYAAVEPIRTRHQRLLGVVQHLRLERSGRETHLRLEGWSPGSLQEKCCGCAAATPFFQRFVRRQKWRRLMFSQASALGAACSLFYL